MSRSSNLAPPAGRDGLRPVAGSRRSLPFDAAERLTRNWRESSRPASLRTHIDRYGPIPGRRSGKALIDAITRAGLTGRGGAAFPTGVKMRSVASRRGPAVVIANGMESEPASEKDKALMSRAPHLVLDGAVLAAEAVGASQVHLCLPRSREWLIAIMTDAVAERRAARADQVQIDVHDLPERYVSSEETALVHWLNGGDARPTATPPRPFEKGVARRPTLVDNVETLANVALIARFGSAWYRQAGLPDAPGTLLTTVVGAVSDPGVFEIEAGTRIGEVLAMGGARSDAVHVLLGGYFGTWHDIKDIAALPLAAPSLRDAGASVGAGVLFVLPSRSCGIRESARVLNWLAHQSAGQCGPCSFGLPAIADDFAQLASGRARGSALDRLDRRLTTVNGRGACRLPDGAVRFARSALTAFSADVKTHVSRRTCLAGRSSAAPPGVLPIPRSAGPQVWQ